MRQLLRGWFMHPGWAWGRLGGGACRPLPPCLLVGQEDPPLAPELQTSPPPDSGPAPIPESAPWPAPPAPGQARPVCPLEVEKLIAVSVWGRRGAAELRKTPPAPCQSFLPVVPPPAPSPSVVPPPPAQEGCATHACGGARHAAHACSCRHPGGRGEKGDQDLALPPGTP